MAAPEAAKRSFTYFWNKEFTGNAVGYRNSDPYQAAAIHAWWARRITGRNIVTSRVSAEDLLTILPSAEPDALDV